MTNFYNNIKNALKNTLPPEVIIYLPRGYQKIGDIAILNLNKTILPYKHEIAEYILKTIPNTRTVCLKKGGITGEYREPHIEVIAGDKGTETIHLENNCYFKLDVKKIMFAKGNISERRRIADLISEDETIIDMFAGIGYFTINIAKNAKPKKIIAIEHNPTAYRYLLENIKLNKVEAIVKPIYGDATNVCFNLKSTANRIIMGLLPAPKRHIPAAIYALQRRGIIHYEGVIPESRKPELLLQDFYENVNIKRIKITMVGYRRIKSYGPKKYHYRIDVKIEKGET